MNRILVVDQMGRSKDERHTYCGLVGAHHGSTAYLDARSPSIRSYDGKRMQVRASIVPL